MEGVTGSCVGRGASLGENRLVGALGSVLGMPGKPRRQGGAKAQRIQEQVETPHVLALGLAVAGMALIDRLGRKTLLLAGAAILGLFALWMRKKGEEGVFPIRLFREPVFIAAILVGLVFNFSNGVLLLSFSNLFQYANDLKGLSLSLMQMPFLLAGIIAALVVGRMRGAGRISQRGAVLVGTIVLAGGLALFAVTAMSRPSNVLFFLPALIITGFGLIIPAIPYGGLFLQEADEKHYGAVSSSRTTVGQFWYALGLAGGAALAGVLLQAEVQWPWWQLTALCLALAGEPHAAEVPGVYACGDIV
mgnify:CR=1 FL=1